jgi:hypothetical protein
MLNICFSIISIHQHPKPQPFARFHRCGLAVQPGDKKYMRALQRFPTHCSTMARRIKFITASLGN